MGEVGRLGLKRSRGSMSSKGWGFRLPMLVLSPIIKEEAFWEVFEV